MQFLSSDLIPPYIHSPQKQQQQQQQKFELTQLALFRVWQNDKIK